MDILSIVVRLLISVSVLLIPGGIIVGIVFAIISSSETDVAIKARNKKIMKWSFLAPTGFLLFVLIMWGLASTISTFVK